MKRITFDYCLQYFIILYMISEMEIRMGCRNSGLQSEFYLTSTSSRFLTLTTTRTQTATPAGGWISKNALEKPSACNRTNARDYPHKIDIKWTFVAHEQHPIWRKCWLSVKFLHLGNIPPTKSMYNIRPFNLDAKTNSRFVEDDILKFIFLREKFCILILKI